MFLAYSERIEIDLINHLSKIGLIKYQLFWNQIPIYYFMKQLNGTIFGFNWWLNIIVRKLIIQPHLSI